MSQQQQLLQRGEIGNCNKNAFGKLDKRRSEERETFIGNNKLIPSSSPSSSAAEETTASTPSQKRMNQQQPVALRSRTTTSAFSYSQHSTGITQGTKKSLTSTTLAVPSTTGATETSAAESGNGGMSFLRNNFPFFRNSTSRSRSQSVISDVSRSSETGDSKKEKDKSYRRKSHLNRAFTDEPVPDNNFTYDATTTPKSSKPTSHDASSLENSAVEESRANHKPAVKLHPAIPSVLTSNKSDSNMSPNKSISRNNSYSRNESIPSPLPTNSHKSSPVVKKDSFSDAEGVSFIKKMLQKESDRDRAAAAAGGSGARQNSQNGSSATVNSNTGNSTGYNIKKSPSAGNQSYWSKFSSSQSAFLRKLFEKPKVSESPVNLNKTVQKTNSSINCSQSGENGEKESCEKENGGEPVLGFSVAQKASFFMKLEHEQRFSKWRKNSVDLGVISGVTDQTMGEISRLNTNDAKGVKDVRQKSRYLTRPVTPSEGNLAGTSSNNGEIIGKNIEFGSLPRMWGDTFHSLDNSTLQSSEKIVNGSNHPSSVQTSSFIDYDDKEKFEPNHSSSKKFKEISTRNMKPISPYTIEPEIKSYSLTRSSRHTATSDKINESKLASFPMYHSASAIINPTGAPAPSTSSSGKHSSVKPSMKFYKNIGNSYSSSSSSFSEAMSRNESIKFLPMTTKNGVSSGSKEPSTTTTTTVYENSMDVGSCNNDKRRGSASDLELSEAANNSPLLSRSEKVKSMFISRNRYNGDADNLSEDGEVSSGGQEVADIICRSYENSPVFRKKNWRTQKHPQSNFTKEIWRRCGNYENWSNRQQPQRQLPQHPAAPQTFTATTNVIEVTTIPPTLPSVTASPPPSTSNLLQILTVLSSSNDELNEPKPKSKKHYRQGSRDKVSGSSSRSDSIPPIHPNHSVVQPRVNTASVNNNSTTNPGPIPSNHRHTMPTTPTADSDVIFVSVPHPEDEAFQSFFCSVKSYTQVTHYPPTNGVIVASLDTNNEHMQHQEGFTPTSTIDGTIDGIQSKGAAGFDDTLDICAVRRESDLLVMKKNVPTCKRKLVASKYKNPLRALAARMDFRQQGYTQTHSTNSNSVQCSSDVDVST